MKLQGAGKAYDDINITPMLDLAYVLLVVFILMTTAGVQGLTMTLPKPSNKPSTEQHEIKIVQVMESGALMVNAPTGEEPWTVCSLLARETRTLQFVTAFQPYHYTPWVAVQQAATYQRATGNRLVWNIINGGSDVIQRQGFYPPPPGASPTRSITNSVTGRPESPTRPR